MKQDVNLQHKKVMNELTTDLPGVYTVNCFIRLHAILTKCERERKVRMNRMNEQLDSK